MSDQKAAWPGAAHDRLTYQSESDREDGRVLDVREDDARVHFLYTGQLRQLFEEELFICLDIFSHDAQQEVHIAQHHVTIENLRIIADRLRERGEIAATVRGKLDVREYHRVEADFLTIDLDGLIHNHALVAQTLYAPPTSGLGQANLLAELRRVHAWHFLQPFEYSAVRLIQIN